MEELSVAVCCGDVPSEFLIQVKRSMQVALDIETSGLAWERDRIATCQLSLHENEALIVRIDGSTPKNLCALIEDPKVKKVFHHAMFDLRFMRYIWGAKVRNAACTKIAAKLLHVGQPRCHRLRWLLKAHLGLVIDKSETLSN